MEPSSRPRAFVIMPFDPSFQPIYGLFIRDALVEAGYDVFRADDIKSVRNILHDIVEAIATSNIIVADLSDENPNVFYELGIAHALRKPVILLTQNIDDVPFDLRSYRLLSYSTHFAEIATARASLKEYAAGFLDGTVLFGSPVSDFFAENREKPPPATDSTAVARAAEAGLPEDDRGFLDHLEDANEGFGKLARIIEAVGHETEVIGTATRQTGEDIEGALTNPSEGTISYVRKLSRRLTDTLVRFTRQLTDANREYREVARSTDNSLEFVVVFQAEASPEDKSALRDQIAEFERILASAQGARDAYRHLSKTMDGIPRMERHLTRALAAATSEIKQMADNIDQTIASLQRAIDIGVRLLSE